MAKLAFPADESPTVQQVLDSERERGLDTLAPYTAFAERTAASKKELLSFVRTAREAGKFVAALGASTKGNVLLQYCGLTSEDILFIGEVNAEKFGCYTPGSGIPIISEAALLEMKPDYLIVLPWHFRSFFERSPKFSSSQLVFPLPFLDIPPPNR